MFHLTTAETVMVMVIVLGMLGVFAWTLWLSHRTPSGNKPSSKAADKPSSAYDKFLERSDTQTKAFDKLWKNFGIPGWATSSTTVSVTASDKSTTIATGADGTTKITMTTPSGTKTVTISVGTDSIPKVTTVDTPAEAKPAEKPVPPKAES